MSNETETDTRWLLEELNDEKAVALIPAMVVLAFLSVLGLLGNSMVCFFYGCKSKTTPATCFILALAIFDMIACSVAIPVEIADMRFFYMFESAEACRLLTFVNHFSVIGSAFTLSAIAVDRYKRICKPFDKQLSIKQAKVVCGVCGALGVLLGWPAIVLYDVQIVNITTTYNVSLTGYDCTSVKDPAYEPYAWAFNVVQFAGFIGVTLALIIAYFMVGRQLYKHKKFRFYVAKKGLKRTASGSNVTSNDYTSDRVMSSSLPVSIPEETETDDGELEEVEFDGPPDDPPLMRESIPDLRELLDFEEGLPDVDIDRPGSALYSVDGDHSHSRSRPNSGRPNSYARSPSSVCTGISGGSLVSKKSIMSLKSVTICDDKQIFNIEPRDKNSYPAWRPSSGRSDSTWSNSITRPNSVSSIATVSRPSSITSIRDRPGSGDSVASRSNAVYPDIPTTGAKKDRNMRRSNSDRNVGKKPNVQVNELRRTVSNDSSKFNGNKSSSSRKSSLRRTSSSDSTKMNTDTDNPKDLRMKMLDINTVKYTIIMIIIAFVFIVSCVPYLALAVYRTYAPDDFVYALSDFELVWFQIGIRSYFLNGAINPLIYGFFNSQFRDFFYNSWCACCKRKKRPRKDSIDNELSDSKSASTRKNSVTK